MIASLAATAGVAIENARLFQESDRRQEWLRASTEITRQLLASDGEEPLQVIARRLQQIADADAVNVVLPTADGRRLMVEVATGAGADELRGLSYPVEGTVSSDRPRHRPPGADPRHDASSTNTPFTSVSTYHSAR